MAKKSSLNQPLSPNFAEFLANLPQEQAFDYGQKFLSAWLNCVDIIAHTQKGHIIGGRNAFGNQLSFTFNHDQYGFSVFERQPKEFFRRLAYNAARSWIEVFGSPEQIEENADSQPE